MLQELAGRTGAAAWVVASMLFFIGAWVWIAIGVLRAKSEDMEARARLVLESPDAAVPQTPREPLNEA
jgi:hypothetical protein